MTKPCRPQASDPILVILADLEHRFTQGIDTEPLGASRIGYNKRSLEKAVSSGWVITTDTGTSETEGGRHRLHLTDAGVAQLRLADAWTDHYGHPRFGSDIVYAEAAVL